MRPTYQLFALFIASSPALADDLRLAYPPEQGNLRLVAIAQSQADEGDLDNGLSCLEDESSAILSALDFPVGAKVRRATLVIAGSLLNDGIDYNTSPPSQLFNTQTLSADSDQEEVLNIARQDADTEVSLRFPNGQVQNISQSASELPFATVFNKIGGTEPGNVGWFATAFDVSQNFKEMEGPIAGEYQLSGLESDICIGLEARCSSASRCSDNGNPHTNATASWALFLLVDDASYALSTVSLFLGADPLLNQTKNFVLDEGIAISSPPLGRAIIYSIEGDNDIGGPGAGPCGGEEYFQVSTGGASLCLSDDKNPIGNIFNRSVAGLPGSFVGVDLDQFDISPALSSGAQSIDIEVSSGIDQVAVVGLGVQSSLFGPILKTDSRLDVLESQDGRVPVGSTITARLIISNTGNVEATNISLNGTFESFLGPPTQIDLPQGITDSGQSTDAGYAVDLQNINVAPGKAFVANYAFTLSCGSLGFAIDNNFQVNADNQTSFALPKRSTIIGGPGVQECEGLFLDDDPRPERKIRGGAACTHSPPSILYLLCFLFFYRRRK